MGVGADVRPQGVSAARRLHDQIMRELLLTSLCETTYARHMRVHTHTHHAKPKAIAPPHLPKRSLACTCVRFPISGLRARALTLCAMATRSCADCCWCKCRGCGWVRAHKTEWKKDSLLYPCSLPLAPPSAYSLLSLRLSLPLPTILIAAECVPPSCSALVCKGSRSRRSPLAPSHRRRPHLARASPRSFRFMPMRRARLVDQGQGCGITPTRLMPPSRLSARGCERGEVRGALQLCSHWVTATTTPARWLSSCWSPSARR